MESLTRLVSESLARHGFDRPLDYRRLHWSRWFRCESHRSLLSVPSKPGVFAVAEEIMNVGNAGTGCPAEQSSALAGTPKAASASPAGCESPRMLAVTKFFEDDDMAFTLDRMLSWQNPMRARLESGRYFIRYVVIEDRAQRRSICNALNQWIASSAEIATGIGTHFASSLEVAQSEPRAQAPAPPSPLTARPDQDQDSRPLTDICCPSLFPSGF
jgi:hypothetical protein